MGYIRGKVRVIIYEAESNYKVGVLKVKETNDKGLEEFLGKSLHFTGYFGTLQVGDNYEIEGNLIYKEKYGYQYLKDIVNYGNETDRLYVKRLD